MGKEWWKKILDLENFTGYIFEETSGFDKNYRSNIEKCFKYIFEKKQTRK
jgi:hypothetical protein